jgi:RNA-directed DNA polymerase
MSVVVRTLAEATGLSQGDVLRIISTAPKRYKTYFIPKRTGGHREISQPAREVKLLQRVFVTHFLSLLPVHACATAYKPGASILDNAAAHAGMGRPILKMDFMNFFPSIKDSDWVAYCAKKKLPFDREDIELSTRLLFKRVSGSRGLRLAIGAPSSPQLSNILMFDFDVALNDFAVGEQVVYTRYADDLTFSAERTGFLTKVIKTVHHTIREMHHPNLSINEVKTTYATAKFDRIVTGLVLANDGRVTIGRDKKRLVRAAVHHASQRRLSPLQMQALAGMLAFINAVEPLFLDLLREKYGVNVVKSIQGTERLPRGKQPKDANSIVFLP